MAEFWEGSPEVEETDQAPAQEDWWSKSAPVKDQQEEWWSQSKPVEPEAEGALATGLRRAAHEIIPMAAGAAGFVAGLPLGGVGAFGTSALAGAGASYLQEKALSALGYDDSHQQAVNAKEHPIASTVGGVAGVLPFFGPGAARLGARVGGAALVGGI